METPLEPAPVVAKVASKITVAPAWSTLPPTIPILWLFPSNITAQGGREATPSFKPLAGSQKHIFPRLEGHLGSLRECFDPMGSRLGPKYGFLRSKSLVCYGFSTCNSTLLLFLLRSDPAYRRLDL